MTERQEAGLGSIVAMAAVGVLAAVLSLAALHYAAFGDFSDITCEGYELAPGEMCVHLKESTFARFDHAQEVARARAVGGLTMSVVGGAAAVVAAFSMVPLTVMAPGERGNLRPGLSMMLGSAASGVWLVVHHLTNAASQPHINIDAFLALLMTVMVFLLGVDSLPWLRIARAIRAPVGAALLLMAIALVLQPFGITALGPLSAIAAGMADDTTGAIWPYLFAAVAAFFGLAALGKNKPPSTTT